MSFVDDDIFERKLFECPFFDQADFVRGDANLKVGREKSGLDNPRTFLFCACEDDDIEVWYPLCKFTGPVLEGGLGNDDKVRSDDAFEMLEVAEERDGLESLSKTVTSVSTRLNMSERAYPISSAKIPFRPF